MLSCEPLSRAFSLALLAAALCCFAPASHAQDNARRDAEPRAAEVDYSTRPDVRAFVRDLATRHGFEQDELLKLFGQVRYQARVVSLMTPPPPGTKRS